MEGNRKLVETAPQFICGNYINTINIKDPSLISTVIPQENNIVDSFINKNKFKGKSVD